VFHETILDKTFMLYYCHICRWSDFSSELLQNIVEAN